MSDPRLILSSPPVVETAITVQFADLANWKSVHHGLYFERVRDRFPDFEQISELAPIIESFPPAPRQLKIQLSQRAAEGCASYTNRAKTELIRIQKNRFAYHWIRSEDGTYPHFVLNSQIWIEEFGRFLTFCNDENVGEVVPVLCEVQYVNHLLPMNGESATILLEQVFGINLGNFEALSLNRTYILGENHGRIYAEIQSAYDDSGQPMLEFKLTARLHHNEADLYSTMQQAHDHLIKHFEHLTVKETRRAKWGSNES